MMPVLWCNINYLPTNIPACNPIKVVRSMAVHLSTGMLPH